MPKAKQTKSKHLKPSTSASEAPSSFADAAFFPFARYTSIVGVHTSLLVFTALFLPRSLVQFAPEPTAERTSKDRPQHPFLEDLTLNPAFTALAIVAGTALLQSWWAGFVRNWWVEYSLRGPEEDKKVERAALGKDKITQFARAWLFTLAASLPLHIVLVLLGAPIATHIPQTYFMALELSILILFVPAYTFGLPSLNTNQTEGLLVRLTWVRLFAEFSIRTPIERAMVYPAIGAALGCWSGAIPIALDWDRPWQAWPLTPLYAGILGYILLSISALTVSSVLSLADESKRAKVE
ncbi:phosphatidylinositol-glycan biosynthesis class f [Moniliophthora roreri MCA 2997]|uniref:Phosphatidylinositol-glycan biosynthesis class f n=2 Tax=Moniliophthora roreri TaxID=221103 RepID=V2Y581_MONRO|nr:phosphatidylinositol-glycan biosynthesis class f [Moniliophthora roreri MCA 2997]KAI3610499.1 phosphatidylinositol-glycan biosynthesis class f [Moniliophthora roreri]